MHKSINKRNTYTAVIPKRTILFINTISAAKRTDKIRVFHKSLQSMLKDNWNFIVAIVLLVVVKRDKIGDILGL